MKIPKIALKIYYFFRSDSAKLNFITLIGRTEYPVNFKKFFILNLNKKNSLRKSLKTIFSFIQDNPYLKINPGRKKI